MKKKISVSDISAHSGLSPATVDRVLHGRSGFSAKSKAKVDKALRQLGGEGLEPDPEQGFQPVSFAFKVFVPALDSHFQQSIIQQAQNARHFFRGVEVDLTVGFIDLSSGQGTIDALRAVDPKETDAVCLFAVDAPGVRDEINRLADLSVHVCTMVSDVPSSKRFYYVGFDNVAAGRTAGRMIDQMTNGGEGVVGVVTGSNQIRDHLERYMGLSQSLSKYSPNLRLLPAEEGHSYNDLNYEITARLLRSQEDLVAIYSIAGGNIGVIKALREFGQDRKLVTVVHELEPEVRDALTDGTINLVLHQNTQSMMRLATEAMIAACEGNPQPLENLLIEMYVAENLP